MKQVIILILVISLGYSFISCKTLKKTETVYNYKDTTTYTYEHKVSYETVTLPGDSANIQALMECDSNGKILIRELEEQKGKFKIKTIYKDNLIKINVSVDSLVIKQQAIEEYLESQSTSQIDNTTTTQTTKTFNWFKVFIWGMIVGVLCSILLYLGIKKLRLW